MCLCVALSNKSGLISIERAIRAILQDIDIAATNNHCSFGKRDQIQSSSRNQCIHLLIYSLLSCWYQYCLFIRPRNRDRRQRHGKLMKRRINTIIGNKMGNKMNNTCPFTFMEGNRNIKIRERYSWLRKMTFHWRGVGRN